MTTRRVALFKSAGRAEGFAQAVRDAGGEPVLVSPYRCEDHADAVPCLRDALRSGATWAVATSPHAAPSLALALDEGFDVRVAAVGPGTAGALHTSGVRTRLVGDGGGADLAAAMIALGCGAGDVVVHAAGEPLRHELREALEAAGARVLTVPVYSMVADAVGERALTGRFAAVVVASPRLAQRAAELFGDASRPPAVAVGDSTAAALRGAGWPPAAVADVSTPEAVCRELTGVLARPEQDEEDR